MHIRILRDTVCDGSGVKAGAIVDARPDTARFLLKIGKAEAVTEPAAPVADATNRAITGNQLQRRRVRSSDGD